VAEGRFRQDLLYRINLMEIRLPTLPEHLEDLPELASFLLHKLGYRHGVLEKQTLKFLQNYHWPGNIRELHNVLERARILSQGAPLFPKHFSYISQEVSPTPSPNTASLKKLEQRQITTVLAQEKGDVLKAAKRLGISRATLYRRLADQQSGG
jgi:transcriptional regulator with PAS, ATPase and Fis domain